MLRVGGPVEDLADQVGLLWGLCTSYQVEELGAGVIDSRGNGGRISALAELVG